MTGQQPRLLLVASRRWLHTVHLALAARRAGFAVGLLAPAGHPVASLDWVAPVGTHTVLRPERSVARALDAYRPALVVPVDDEAAAAAFDAYGRRDVGRDSRETLTASFGDPATFGTRVSRGGFAALAAEQEVVAAPTVAVRDVDHLDALVAASAGPVVLKSDGSFGGMGVVVAGDASTARQAFEALRRPQPLARSVARLVRDDDGTFLRASLARGRPEITVQPYVSGHPATITVACWRGEVLTEVAVRAVVTRGEKGPSTVVERVQVAGMSHAARRVVAALGASGLCGLDFLLTPSGEAVLLELNPRATPTAHLSALDGEGLLSALARRVGGRGEDPAAAPPARAIVALYPQERLRDPHSAFVGTDAEDVPCGAPDVVALCETLIATPMPSLPRRVLRRWNGRGRPAAPVPG
jgi:hypothetical protein